MKSGVTYKNEIFISNQASILQFRPVLPLYKNQSNDIWSKLMGWFPYNGNTGLK